MKYFVYNFGGQIYETTTAFDDTYRTLRNQALENGEVITRQVVDGDKVNNEYYHNGMWLDEDWKF